MTISLHAATDPALYTAGLLPYPALARAVAELLADASVTVPTRQVLPLPGGGSLFVMPAHDEQVAMTKLITYTPGNAARGLPSIQGDVLVLDVATGTRQLLLDGPTVTARRTAAVSLLAAQHLATTTEGPLLVVGAGVQGRSHLEAFAEGLGVREVWVASRRSTSAEALAAHARHLGLRARVVTDANAALPHCPLVVTCTPASEVVLSALPGSGQFIAAVGAFTPRMVELSAPLCRHVAKHGTVVVDTADAAHEAGDLLQAGLDVAQLPTLAQALNWGPGAMRPAGPVLFKSCGWAGWDLAAARLALGQASR
ncbi:MAG: delta(1)-pyrroline-2-carboxylate reductase family protein [Burkholderiales bacterium]|nr:delta(1)-pyrroline-2-carboxylate reductase family protein [Burkholderiales bacterium]